jgi:predicted Zn-dependent protease
MNRMIPLIPLALALALSPLACKTLSQASDAAQRGITNVALPVSEEIKLGKQLAKEVEKENKLHKSDAVQDYVDDVGDRLLRKVRDKPDGMKFTFKVIDDDKTVNAFALPGGHIYVYSGLLKMADDEAELACILGHEIAHVTQRHVAERLVAAYGLDALLTIALGNDPGAISQIAAQIVAGGTMMKFSRVQESEADAKGVPYAVRAGYDPNGFIRFFNKLKKGEGPGVLVFLQDHPLPSDRIEDVKSIIANYKNPPDERNKDEFVAMQGKL